MAAREPRGPGQLGALGQPPLGDYLGIQFNDAGRQRADTTPESIWGTPEYQCRPHSAPHQWRGLGGARILKADAVFGELSVIPKPADFRIPTAHGPVRGANLGAR